MLRLNAALCYHKGLIRESQEDNYYFHNTIGSDFDFKTDGFQELLSKPPRLLLAVFDGMGGLRYGEEASYTAANVLAQKNRKLWKPVNEVWFRNCIQEMNEQVYRNGVEHGCTIGTTAAIVRFGYRKALLCNVGDSRIYRHRNGVLEQLSIDHSDQELLKQIGANKKASLLQFVGMSKDEITIEPTIASIKYRSGDRFILCSDGLTDMVTEEEIDGICSRMETASECAKQLVQKALGNGGKDNITVVVADVFSPLCGCRKHMMEEQT